MSSYKLVIAALVAGLLIIVYMALSGFSAGFGAYVFVAIGTLVVVGKLSGPAAAASRRPKDPKAALRRYEAINPPTNKLGPGPYRPDRGRETKLLEGPSDGRGDAALVEIETGPEPAKFSHIAAYDRVLVCEHPEYRDFYVANDFHLHHACHVMGPDDLDTEDGRQLLGQMKQEPELDVFVVHDATPLGVMFADEVQSDGRWFGGHAAATVLDIGLIPDQISMFEVMLRPLRPGEMEGVADSVPGLPVGMGTDLSVIPAGPLLSLTGASVDERLRFDKNSYTERKSKDKRRDRAEGDWWFYVGGDGE